MEQEYKHSVSFPSEREIRFTREFDAAIGQVWDAFTRPELIKKWMIGPGGWSMPVCEVEPRVGGTFRYQWASDDGAQTIGMGGVFIAFDPLRLIKCTQVFDEDWTDGEAVGTLSLTERGGKTVMENTILYKSKATRDAVLRTPMERGMAAGFDRIDRMLTGSL